MGIDCVQCVRMRVYILVMYPYMHMHISLFAMTRRYFINLCAKRKIQVGYCRIYIGVFALISSLLNILYVRTRMYVICNYF